MTLTRDSLQLEVKLSTCDVSPFTTLNSSMIILITALNYKVLTSQNVRLSGLDSERFNVSLSRLPEKNGSEINKGQSVPSTVDLQG